MKHFDSPYHEGADVESGVLGEVDPSARLTIEQYLHGKEQGEFRGMSFMQALDMVRDKQPFKEPSFPVEKIFTKDLHIVVRKALGLQYRDQLRYYTAVGSLLDKWGADAVFELLLEDGKTLIVTLDITTVEDKLITKKADVSFVWPREGLNLNETEDMGKFNTIVDDVASRVVEAFMKKAEDGHLMITSLEKDQVQTSIDIVNKRRDNTFRPSQGHRKRRPLRERIYG